MLSTQTGAKQTLISCRKLGTVRKGANAYTASRCGSQAPRAGLPASRALPRRLTSGSALSACTRPGRGKSIGGGVRRESAGWPGQGQAMGGGGSGAEEGSARSRRPGERVGLGAPRKSLRRLRSWKTTRPEQGHPTGEYPGGPGGRTTAAQASSTRGRRFGFSLGEARRCGAG